MDKHQTCNIVTARKGWSFLLPLLCVFLFSFSVQAQVNIPGCNTDLGGLLDKIPSIPGIEDVQTTLDMGVDLIGMADDDIFDHLGSINPMLDNLDPDKLVNQLNNMDSLLSNPSLETAGILGGGIEGILGNVGLPQLDGKLRKVFDGLKIKKDQEPDPAKKQKHQERMDKIGNLIGKWGDVVASVEKSQNDLNDWIEKTGVLEEVTKAQGLLAKANDPSLIGSDITGVLGDITGLDMGKLGDLKNKFDEMCGLMPQGLWKDKIAEVVDSYATGALQTAMDALTQVINNALDSLLDQIPDDPVKDAIGDAAGALASGDVQGALTALANSGINSLMNSNGGVTGVISVISGITTGNWCTPKLSEKIKCPEIECDDNIGKKGLLSGSKEFVKRVEAYFEYKPPHNNRSVYLDKNLHDYEINKPGERTRGPAYNMDQPSNGCNSLDGTLLSGLGLGNGTTGGDVSEPCQDNRWRDMCLIGDMQLDMDYQLTGRKLMADEEPLPGVAGSSPVYKRHSVLGKLNCLVPKNTERKSPLELDNGWRYRDACPGNQKLRRVERDRMEDTLDLFRGEYGCLAPLPKCDLKNDWKLGSVNWKNANHGKYLTSFGSGIISTITSTLGLTGDELKQKLKALLTSGQFSEVEDLMKPLRSAAAECKPAYWVRLMLDSCANQYILQKSFNPNYVYNPDGRKEGYSPRFCQPFKAKLITQEEYKVSDYLKRSYKGLLNQDYMPWVEYDRHEGKFAKDSEDYRKNNWPERKIKWPLSTKPKLLKGYHKIKQSISINDYATHPVERIVDPLHPYSPRYDIATLTDETLLTDRNLFGKSTESKAHITWAKAPGFVEGLKKYWCVPRKKERNGYWEFDCSIYCSAVEVDLLRFRYKDYRLCMGCQIDTNEKAFWEEWEANRKYYNNEYCWTFTNKDECEYGDEICGTCWDMVIYDALCVASCIFGCSSDLCEDAAEYTEACIKCGQGAKAEALERARQRTNHEEEPEWGPTAVGDNWPVCSTRFDHTGDVDLCKKAKEEYTCDNQGAQAENDPNIAVESKDAAEQCIEKDYKDICHDAAKPVYSVNFLKIRTRKGSFATGDTKPDINLSGSNFKDKVDDWRSKYADEDPAPGYGFREYFGNHRPYMRWWDTGKEAFQVKTRPDYWCDWGQNDAIMGVGRDYNSIHGRKAQLCRYGGGGGIGDDCFTMQDWKNGTGVPNGRKFPDLAGSEWAELKMYQANCFRQEGLNCLCQYEKVFKELGSEDKVLALLGATPKIPVITADETTNNYQRTTLQTQNWPLSWRGYASTPPHRDTAATSPAISTNQQFPYLFGNPSGGSIVNGGLDKAQAFDIAIWPSGSGALPHVAIVEATNNLNDYGTIDKVPNKSRWVRVSEANNGKYPDACGNTSWLGRGEPRTLYADKDEMPKSIQKLIAEQVASTYYCDDPELGHCVERRWDDVVLYRPYKDNERTGN